MCNWYLLLLYTVTIILYKNNNNNKCNYYYKNKYCSLHSHYLAIEDRNKRKQNPNTPCIIHNM